MPRLPSGLSALSFGAVVPLLAGVAVLVAGVAAITTVRRDIT
jgi:hypothetical protein